VSARGPPAKRVGSEGTDEVCCENGRGEADRKGRGAAGNQCDESPMLALHLASHAAFGGRTLLFAWSATFRTCQCIIAIPSLL
jgi:hypothetical protein